MATVIGGLDTGILDGSLYLLNRDDKTREGQTGHGEELFVNVSNGNLVVRHTDAYLPSQGEDFAVVRTYNSQGTWNEGVGQGWTITTAVELTQITANDITLRNADGSYYVFEIDRTIDTYISTDGNGAYETIIEDANGNHILTRADQTQLTFDINGTLLQSIDTNGNTITYVYEASKLVQVIDDTGHSITYVYGGSLGTELTQIIDSDLGVLVTYTYGQGLLGQVTDRNGDVTTYQYDTDGMLWRINLPHDPTIEADIGKERVIEFNFGGDLTLDSITDAEGNRTDFIYNFDTVGANFFGGSTAMVNSLGLNRAFSNDAEYVQWRVDNGYYATYDQLTSDAAQVSQILENHATWYYYDADGNITLAGAFKNSGGNRIYEYADRYGYDELGNLTTIIDANGYALQYSDDPLWRDLRKELGFVDPLTGEGLLSAQLTTDQLAALAEYYTTHLEYDASGNLIKKTDNEDNVTTFTYTSFNKIASETSAMGHALTTSNDQFYQDKRVELGYAADVTLLSAADITALLDLYTTTYSYDAKQNLIEIRTPGGDLTTFAYDVYGNVTQKTVYLDQADLLDPAKQQITQYFYDAYGNNVKTIEANAWSITHSDDAYWVEMRKEFGIVDINGNGKLVIDLSAADITALTGQYTSSSSFDLFGNLLTYTDGNGGVTTYAYDADHRLISVQTAEGNITAYAYDSVGNRIGVTNANGHQVIYVYDRNNMLIAVQDWKTADGLGADDRTTAYKYDVVGNRTSVIDANGFETTYIYREDNRLLEVLTPVVDDATGTPVQYSTSYSYDAVGNRIQINDNNGNISNYVYNRNGLLKQVTDPIGNVTQYSYDANLNQVQITIGAHLASTQRRVLNYRYDEEDQLIAEVDAEGQTTTYNYDAVGNVIQVVDANGHVYDFTFDAQNRQIIETKPAVTDPVTGLPVRYTVVHYFDGNGNQIAGTDENGNTSHVAYDLENRAVLIEDGNGIKTVYEYDAVSNRTAVRIGVEAHLDVNGKVVLDNVNAAQTTTYTYDEFNQLVLKVDGLGNALIESDEAQYIALRAELGYVDALGNGKLVADLLQTEKDALKALYTERYSYDKNGNLTQSVDNAGNTTTLSYDALNRQTSVTDALNNTTIYQYDGNANRVSTTDALGRTTSFSYDANDRLIDTTDAHGIVTHREYDDFGNLTAQTEAFGTLEARTTQYVYDLNNRLIDNIDPLGHQTHYEYDAVGNRLKTTTAFGTVEAQTTQYVYDALDRTIKVIDPLNFETKYEYDGVGNRISLIDANGGISRFEFDAGNRQIQTTDAEGRVTTFVYDVRGNAVSQTTAFGTLDAQTTTYEYDAENNLRAVVDAEGNRTEHDYDTVYNRISTIDGNGNTTSYAFDAINRQISVTDALGHVTSYAYDAVSNRTSVTDALGRITSFAYDNLNQLITQTAADGVQTTYSYDVVGNRTSVTAAANTTQAATTTYEYNLDDQLVKQTDALGNITSYTYDANHQQTVVTDANNHATTYTYDDNNRVIAITDPAGHITQYVYDGNGNRVQVIDANSNTSTTYYNSNNEVSLSIDAKGYATGYVYDNNGNVVSQTRYMNAITAPIDPAIVPTVPTSINDQTVTFEYDALNRQVARVDGEGYRTGTTYDAVGNVLSRTDGNGYITTYVYDADNRLISTTDASGATTSYSYDAVDNRLSVTDANGHVTTYAYDVMNRVTTQTDASNATTTYSYDAVGNRTAVLDALGRTTSNAYNLLNQLISSTDALGVESTYSYDNVGNRLTLTTAANTPIAATTTYTYDADNLMTSQTDALGNITTYTYDANHNQTVVTDANGNATTYAYDANNRVIAVTDAAGQITQYVYDGNGNRIQIIDANGNITTNYYNKNNAVSVSIDARGYATSYVYDDNGNVVSQTLHMSPVTLPVDPAVVPAIPANAADQTVTFAYDSVNRLAVRVDGEGYRTEYSYDAVGNRTETRQQITADGLTYAASQTYYDEVNRVSHQLTAEGYLTSYSYDAVGNRTSTTLYNDKISVPVSGDPVPALGDTGRTTGYSFDANNRLLSETSALGITTAYTYDARGNQISVTDAQGAADERVSHFSYDNLNRLTDTTNANGVITHYVHDGVGNVLERYDAYGSLEQRLTSYVYDTLDQIVSETDALGVISSYSYDANGNRLTTTLATGVLGVERTLSYEYDANNQLSAEVNGAGERTEYVYDGAGNRITTIQAPGILGSERSNSFEYNKDNQLVATVDALGTRTEYVYDGAGNKLQTTQAVGQAEQRVSSYVYDADNRLLQVTDPQAGVTQYSYDALGNQSQIIDANGGIQVNSFDAEGQLIQTVSAGGVMTVNVYDARGNIISTTQSRADGTDARTTTYTFNKLDQQIAITDAEGFTTSITYDEFGNQTNVINGQYLVDPLDPAYDAAKAARATGVSSSFSFDAGDRMISMTDSIGTVTSYAYDAVGNRTSMTETANSTPRLTTYSYDLANRQLTSVNPEGGKVESVYDAVGNKTEERMLQSVDALGAEVWSSKTYEYDANGNMTAEIDPYGTRTEHEYDAMGNMTVHRYAAGTLEERIVRMEYDFNNRLTADIDAEGNRTTYTYDSMGNRATVTDALGRVATYVYDGSNNLINVTDPEGNITSYTYDSAGNQTSVTLGTRTTTFEFDGVSNISLRTDADGSQTRYEFDASGNMLKEIRFANTTSPRELLYVYDNNSRLTQFTDADGTVTTFTYDAANNKTSESIYNVTDPNTTRTTTFSYDLNNRKVSDVFDPTGLNYVQTLTYDKLGNVVQKTDANGTVMAYNYDLNNRIVNETVDPNGLNLLTGYQYDAVGNMISETDPRGNTTNYVYDNNNRQIQMIAPLVTVYNYIAGNDVEGPERPTVTRVYDAAGNVIQETDPNGVTVTRYYDGNNRIVAEIDGHDALREYTYNATGEQVEVKLYMTRLTLPADAVHDPYVRPPAPAGEVRVTTNVFDVAGRIIETLHPQTEITTLVGGATTTPSVTTLLTRATESWSYDQFGNQIEYIDKNGNRNVYYYDVAGNMIAHVDGVGYLTEWDYDAQGNQLEQRTYANTLDVALVDASIYPTAPAGNVDVVSKAYDAASNLIEERTPVFAVYNPLDPLNPTAQQQMTLYTYDANGNQLSKTIAAGSGSEITEYSYYDNNNRAVAVINGARVLHLYTYDANGNVTKQERFYNTVPLTDATAQPIDLATLTGATDFRSLVVADTSKDQTSTFVFDAANNKTSETDLMGPGTTDDLTQIYKYNAGGQQTWTEDEGGYVTRMAFNGLGLAETTVSPDGSGIVTEYDAAGNQISGFMGKVANATTPATNIIATVSDTLNLSWTLGSSTSMGSRVVYGTTSQASTSAYTYQTGLIGSWDQTQAATQINLANFTAGDTVYFRVITQDKAGNITWSDEKAVTIPPRITDVRVDQPTADSLTITANFEAGAQSPLLLYGAIQNTIYPVDFVLQVDGSYQANITGITNPQDFAYQIQWSDAAGRTYTSTEHTFEAQGGHTAVISTVGEGTVTTATGTGYVMNLHTEVPTALGETFSVVSAEWLAVGASTGYASTAIEGVLDAGGAFYNFDLTLGSTTSPLAAGEYEVIIRGVDASGQSVILDTLTYTLGVSAPILTSQSVSFAAPAIGNSQLVIVDGVRVDSVRQDNFATFDINAAGTQAYQVYYTDQLADSHSSSFSNDPISHTVATSSTVLTGITDLGVNATFSAWEVAQMSSGVTLSYRPAGSTGAFSSVVLTQTGNNFGTTLTALAAGQYELQLSYTDVNAQTVIASTTTADTAVASNSVTYTTGYNLNVSSALSAAEIANINGDVTLSWRAAGTGLDFVNSQIMSIDTLANTLSSTIENVAAGQYDIKVAYTDINGNEVVVDWYRADTSIASDTITEYSQTLLGAEERAGAVTLNANGTLSVDPGLYIGDLTGTNFASELSLPVDTIRLDSDSKATDGSKTGYFTEMHYNAMGEVIAEVGEDGLYKEYALDANGNRVATYLYGEKTNTSAITSYAAFDARDRQIAQFDAAFMPDGGTVAQHPVTSMIYNAQDQVISQKDARGNITLYDFNALGLQTSMTDAGGATTRYYYDIRGNEVAVTDHLGHTSRKEYDQFGRVTADINGVGDSIRYTYDSFGRKLTETLGTSNTTSYAYDQRDRMTSKTDALDGVTRYDYDSRDNQTRVYDARWTATDTTYTYGQKYDEMGRVVESSSYQNGQIATEKRVYDYYGNLIAETDAAGRTTTTSYAGFGRVSETVDEGGQRIIKQYDTYGRLIREYDPNGSKDIRYAYDANGNQISINDLATTVSTVYTYDLAGNRITESITTPLDAQGESTHNRSYTYVYDSRGNMVRWADSVTGMHLNYLYDAAGNLQRAFTDIGYDPDGLNKDANGDPIDLNFRHVDNYYQYDNANRVRLLTDGQGGPILGEYGYDNAGNRNYFMNDKGVGITYTFDANGQVKTGTWYTGPVDSQVKHQQTWNYDKVGNVLDYRVYEGTTQTEYSEYKYFENNTQYYSNSKPVDSDSASNSTSTFDISGRLTKKVTRGSNYTITYNYSYYADGRERSISASGDSSGSASFAYDANNNQTKVNLGKGNDQSRAEISTFMYDNEGHIIYKWHDDGSSATREKIEYAYANGNPVGETGTNNDAQHLTKLDTEQYNLIENFGDTHPGTSVTLYSVNEGDTLQSIAGAMYGNPSLWFVIAAANGLTGNEQLDAGRKLQVPNTVQSGRITSETHVMYEESDIIGSTLPNLQSAGGGGGGCAGLLAIVIIVAIAIIAPYAVAALAGTMTAALGTIAAYAIAGAVVYAAANIIQQGLLMAIGVQQEFDWGQVGTAAVSGLFAGAAAGYAAEAEALAKAGEAASTVQHAKVASTALKVVSVASKQYMTDGKITSWTGLAAAGIGQYLSVGSKVADAQAGIAKTQEAVKAAEAARNSISEIQTVVEYATPWVQLAETYIRNDGELTPQDWAGAVSSTINTAIPGSGIDAAINRIGANLLVAGALKQSAGSEEAESFFYNVVGNEAGKLLGGAILSELQGPPKLPEAGDIRFNDQSGQYEVFGTDGQYESLAGTLPSVTQVAGAQSPNVVVNGALLQAQRYADAFGGQAINVSANGGEGNGADLSLQTQEQRAEQAALIAGDLQQNPDAALQSLSAMRELIASGDATPEQLQIYITTLVALGGTDPGMDFNNYDVGSGQQLAAIADYALSSSIGDMYIKAQISGTTDTGNENLQLLLMSRDSESRLSGALTGSDGQLRTESGGYGRIGPATQASINEQDLINSSILRDIYQGGVSFSDDNTAAAYVPITIDGVTKVIDFQSTFASSMWPANATLDQQRESNLNSIQGVRPDTYVALLKGIYSDDRILGATLSGGLRPGNTSQHSFGLGLDVAELYLNDNTTIDMQNEGYRLSATNRANVYNASPENPYQTSANADIANNFNSSVASAYGVRGTGLNPGRSIPNVTLQNQTDGALVSPGDMLNNTTGFNNTIALHYNHTHIEMNQTVRGPRENDLDNLLGYQRSWQLIESDSNPWLSL